MIAACHQRAVLLVVGDDAADGVSAEADAGIAARAADHADAAALPAGIVIGERHLQRGVDGFRAGVTEKDVVEIGRSERGDAAGKLERLRMRKLEGRRVVDRGRRVNERLAVNGIQKGARSLGTVATLAMGASLYGSGPDAGVRRSAAPTLKDVAAGDKPI